MTIIIVVLVLYQEFWSSVIYDWSLFICSKKGFSYSLPSIGHGADPGVQSVSPQVTLGAGFPLQISLPLMLTGD